ncbi:hypothetical protein XI09_13925 [Bradyrhizobium sp. CCBAU 11386]|uniref:hypothetical protein n=1 Tax=Bradyrhizobium sp. CCBAU 11386 TaxID=1630837 RepID=UPI002302BC30|nr:hypothetical protein [Bradyrhizobium sp. CCBAU 11386]MDA9505724.1 hypothetical protein [Bradyrhizobium sp. CCBAU 11386]
MAKATIQARDAPGGVAMARATGALQKIETKRLCLSVFSRMPHGSDKACHARLRRIDPIQVWINAERRLIGLERSKMTKAAGS